MRSYNKTLDYLFGMLPMFQRQGPSAFKKNLDNIKKLLDAIGNPEQSFKCIHIAGTNGKGSTSHFMASIMQEQGLRVGLYTSPHYKDFRERIKINGEFISKMEVQQFIHDLEAEIATIRPSFFELTVAMAFDYFSKSEVDVAIIETGLGGRLDSTNVITPLLSVITNIGLDHQNMLGDTLTEIAGEKAGIIKHKIPVLIGERQPEVEQVFIDKSADVGTTMSFADEIVAIDKKGIYLLDANEQIEIDLVSFPEYQLKNIKTAVASLLKLDMLAFDIPDKGEIKKGIVNVHQNSYFIGRWMILNETPLTIADSAHNVDGIKYLVEQLSTLDYERLHVVMGVVDDKDHESVFPLMPRQADYYFCKADIPRGMAAKKLQTIASQYDLKGMHYISVRKAAAAAKSSANDRDLILICGSIFVVAEVV